MMIATVMSGLLALVLALLKRSYPPSIKGLEEWSLGLLLMCGGGLLGLLGREQPPLIGVALANLLVNLGVYAAYVGTQRFLAQKPRLVPWLLLIAAVAAVSLWYTVVEPNYTMRLRISNGYMALQFLIHAVLVMRHATSSFARSLGIATLISLVGIQGMRFTATFTSPSVASPRDASPEHLIYLTGMAVCVLLFAIGAVLGASDRLRIEVERLAARDPVTRLLNRRYLDESARKELERCRRHGYPLSLLMMDLDHFKSVNDTHGHLAGDEVLAGFAHSTHQQLRMEDHLGRFGGEEFVAILPETIPEDAYRIAERIRRSCLARDDNPKCSVSIGVSSYPRHGETLEDLLRQADRALYTAKSRGRNRVELA
ncbi:MAG: GGDEF domain-containing protein [Rhodoferax sp.]|nr:GGDEF domain-containing protein [Rhodoferax sp.]